METDKAFDAAVIMAVSAMAEAFNRTTSKTTVNAYRMGLEGLTAEQVTSAAKRALRTCKFMPSPAEMRELSGELPPADRSVIAWTCIMRSRSKYGYYHSVNFDDPAINAAIRSMGGWERLATRFEEESEPFLKREFDRAYLTYAKRGVTVGEGAPLIGYIDRENAATGYEPKPPVLIKTTLMPTPMIGAHTQNPLGLIGHEVGRIEVEE